MQKDDGVTNIVFREIDERDYENLEKIICKTWEFDKDCTEKTAVILSKAYLSNCLKNQTYTEVAIVDGNVAGVIVGRNTKKLNMNFKIRIRKFFSVLKLKLTREGRRVVEIKSEVDSINKKLLKKSKYDYGGEIPLFIMDEKYRGFGIGKSLFKDMLKFMGKDNVKSLYLYTDTDCNYKFYEKQGMKRRKESMYSCLTEGFDWSMKLFLYDMVS